MSNKTSHAGLLLIGATTALFGLELQIISMSPSIEDPVLTYLRVTVLAGLTVTVATLLGYGLATRRARSAGRLTRFEQKLQLRDFALRAITAGLLSVSIGMVWYVFTRVRNEVTGVDVLAVGTFAVLGTLFVVLMLMLGISFERQAIQVAHEEARSVVAA